MTAHAPQSTAGDPVWQKRVDVAVAYRLFCRPASMQQQQLYLGQASRPLNWEATVRNLMHSISAATATSSRYQITRLRHARRPYE